MLTPMIDHEAVRVVVVGPEAARDAHRERDGQQYEQRGDRQHAREHADDDDRVGCGAAAR